MVIQNKIPLQVKYINDTMGFGVFACEDILSNVVVETCYSIKTYNQVFNPSFDYLFTFSDTEALLPFGYGPIYNHSNDPNIHWRIVNLDKLIIEFFSLREIKMGEELCHNYGPLYWKTRKKKLL